MDDRMKRMTLLGVVAVVPFQTAHDMRCLLFLFVFTYLHSGKEKRAAKMFERYLTEALTTHFGHFVQNLDAEKVRLSAWHGELVLEDLELRHDALDALMAQCPVEIAWGRIGNLELRIPWKLLRSWRKSNGATLNPTGVTSCSIVLSDVNIVITPRRRKQRTSDSEAESETDEQSEPPLSLEEKRIHKEKDVQQRLDATLLRQRIAGDDEGPNRRRRWVQWIHSLVTKLLSTLSVTVRDIHVRYEDPGTCLGFILSEKSTERRHRPPFAVGVTLRQFSVQTTDRGSPLNENPENKSPNDEKQASPHTMRHKLVAAYQLSIYWDTGCHLVSTNSRNIQKAQLPLSKEDDNGNSKWTEDDYYSFAFAVLNDVGGYSFFHRKRYSRKHTYLLNPVSPSLHLSLPETHTEKENVANSTDSMTSPVDQGSSARETPQSAAIPTPQQPPSTLVLTAPPCHLGIARNTLEDMVYIRKSLNIWNKSQEAQRHESTMRQLTKLRPLVSPLANPRSWWRYAVEATVLLSKLSRGEEKGKRKRGWRGFMHALRKRRIYLRHYRQVLSESSSEAEKELAHQALLQMEDELLSTEIVAFRLAVYTSHTSSGHDRICESGDNSDSDIDSSSKWQDWLPSFPGGSTDLDPRVETEDDKNVKEDERGSVLLSHEHRRSMFLEMKQALDREKENESSDEELGQSRTTDGFVSGSESTDGQSPILWQASINCPELALQVNDQPPENDADPSKKVRPLHREEKPIVRLCCASVLKYGVREDSSWELDCSVASLELKELMTRKPGKKIFSNLLGPKSNIKPEEDSVVYIDGEPHRHCASVSVKRTVLHGEQDAQEGDGFAGTITRTQIRLSPLEIVYATKPFEALTRVFSTMKTPELVDDYYRMAWVVIDWRARQKQRLLNALAHRRKKIFVDVNIAAPVILIPENWNKRDCSLLVVDLGRVQFHNVPDPVDSSEYDDMWQLQLSNLQILCSSTLLYLDTKPTTLDGTSCPVSSHQLVEPFSLEFSISTKIANSEVVVGGADKTRIRISATLPRLIFNLTTSAVRLVLRLQLQWAQRKAEASSQPSAMDRNRGEPEKRIVPSNTTTRDGSVHTVSVVERCVAFFFSAPLIAFKLENDVDGRDCTPRESMGESPEPPQNFLTPLVDLALRGIRGSFVQEISTKHEISNKFEAKLKSVDSVDLYQRAGHDFKFLLSSLSPDSFNNSVADLESFSWQRFLEKEDFGRVSEEENTDLVSVRYSSCYQDTGNPLEDDNVQVPDTMAVRFHELYVEWNPETFAAVQKSLRLPPHDSGLTSLTSASIEDETADDEFYDALEEDDVDEESFVDSETYLISVISSRSTSASDFRDDCATDQKPFQETLPMLASVWSPSPALASSVSPFRGNQSRFESSPRACDSDRVSLDARRLEVSFNLSKLRLNFNKESRHRRLLIAEMDQTDVHYSSTATGGSKTVAKIGNLCFSDPACIENRTLYGKILGLKAEPFLRPGKSHASLLEMEFEVLPRTRQFKNLESPTGEHMSLCHERQRDGVTIDPELGQIEGCDFFLSLNFSPMRFVLLEQLWFEVIDYFFEGILGYAVWGKQAPSVASNTSDTHSPISKPRKNLPGAGATGFSVTRFEVKMDAPVLLLPVSYRSPQYLRLEFSETSFSNHYSGFMEGHPTKGPSYKRIQWYNNCGVTLHDLKLVSWCGTQLSWGLNDSNPHSGVRSSSPANTTGTVDAFVRIKWPVGPTAPLVIPKWNIHCKVNSMNVVLRRADYALFQHIVSYNIGEPSRHLEEWKSLQNLPVSELESYKKSIIVHFGYDKKDSAPTTYDVDVAIPSVRCFLSHSASTSVNSKSILDSRCTEVKWCMRKRTDRIFRQRITCDISVFQPVSGIILLRPLQGESSTADIPCSSPSLNQNDPKMLGGAQDWEGSEIRELTYTSSSRPSGDNVKTLEIADMCIFPVHSAWLRVKEFFQDLPFPNMMSPEDIMQSIEIGDRWYHVGSSEGDKKHADSRAELKAQSSQSEYQPSYQFRLLLTSPHIVLEGAPVSSKGENADVTNNVTLSLSHLDYLHSNNGLEGKIRRSFFVHDLELYISSEGLPRVKNIENSLIRPWCAGGSIERCNYRQVGNCDEHNILLFSDVMRARAAYSDISTTFDVFRHVVADYRRSKDSSVASRSKHDSPKPTRAIDFEGSQMSQPDNEAVRQCITPAMVSIDVICDGMELLVVDDSQRHFANAQELITFSLGQISFGRERYNNTVCDSKGGTNNSNILRALSGTLESFSPAILTSLRLTSLDIYDCLQRHDSKFRLLATSRLSSSEKVKTNGSLDPFSWFSGDGSDSLYNRSQPATSTNVRRMNWGDFCKKPDNWGFVESSSFLKRIQPSGPATAAGLSAGYKTQSSHRQSGKLRDLIEVQATSGLFTTCDVKLRSLTLQWNPSTVIALQRFLGRLKKEAIQKLGRLGSPLSKDPSAGRSEESKTGIFTNDFNGRFAIERLTVCLNKEHQDRRLLRATLSGSELVLDCKNSILCVDGSVEDFTAWDPDNYGSRCTHGIFSGNREVARVIFSDMNNEQCDEESKGSDRKVRKTLFLSLHYKTFWNASSIVGNLPEWVLSHFSQPGLTHEEIDDYLRISVATLQLTYIKERTAEILDYLSNGLPGKGMGATSRAARGFINKRIETRSFLELNVKPPRIKIPRHEGSESGVMLRLGDVRFRSWFEGATNSSTGALPPNSENGTEEVKEWWRILSVSVQGIGFNTFERYSKETSNYATLQRPVDLHFTLRKPTWHGRTTNIRAELSFVDLTLKYMDYVLLRAVLRENIGRDVDMSRWDNVEKAYWLGEATHENAAPEEHEGIGRTTKSDVSGAGHVVYSSDARFIRYGAGAKKYRRDRHVDVDQEQSENQMILESDEMKSLVDLRLDLNGLSITLHRDDVPDPVRKEGNHCDTMNAISYDVVLFRVQLVVMSVSTNSAGDKSFHLALYHLALVDLGDEGRSRRSLMEINQSGHVNGHTMSSPCAFCILAEGYSPIDIPSPPTVQIEEMDPQFSVTVEQVPKSSLGNDCAASNDGDSKVTVARIVINYLSVNALIRPVREVVSFVTCSWSSDPSESDDQYVKPSEKRKTRSSTPIRSDVLDVSDNGSRSSGFEIKLVAHYPRVFFVADESDPNSRALVLRGLAVVNASIVKQSSPIYSEDKQELLAVKDVRTVRGIDAHLHNMESYINPDVGDALCARPRHAELLPVEMASDILEGEKEQPDGDDGRMLGIALMQPVTAGLEYFQVERDRFPTLRTACVNIESVSAMISFEDLTLIKAVLNRWSSKRSSTEKPKKVDQGSMHNEFPTYDVRVFSAEHGLVFAKTEDGATVVNSTKNMEDLAIVEVGDSLVAVDSEDVSTESLEIIVQKLENSPRPVTATFRRNSSYETHSQDMPVVREVPRVNPARTDAETAFDESTSKEGHRVVYSLDFYRGQQNGLSVERSACGNVPVVTSVSEVFLEAVAAVSDEHPGGGSSSSQIEGRKCKSDMQIPHPGAVILRVNGESSADLGYENVLSQLDFLGNDPVLSSESIDSVDPHSLEPHAAEKYSITFLEMNSSEWGNVDKVDVTIKTLGMTFIDDFCGRDMPLFRGHLTMIELHLERGIGIDTDERAPSATLPSTTEKPTHVMKTNGGPQSQYFSEKIVRFDAIARTRIEYYHPHIAIWEPLLETSQLSFLLEWHAGTITIPAHLSVELSDRVLCEERSTFLSTLATTSSPESLCVNLTDAAAEVLFRAVAEWKEWRRTFECDNDSGEDRSPLRNENLTLKAESDEIHVGQEFANKSNTVQLQSRNVKDVIDLLPGLDKSRTQFTGSSQAGKFASSPKADARLAAARKTVQVAFSFAEKRGAGKHKKGDSAKPFVFRNRTGLLVAFAQEKGNTEVLNGDAGASFSERFLGVEYTELEDGCDARFHMVVISPEVPSTMLSKDGFGSVESGTRVRAYDGQLPFLAVAFDTVSGVNSDAIRRLQVAKVGSTVRRFRVYGAGFHKTLGHFSVPVIWTVEIEDNRRVLTLSSAVKIMSLGLNTTIAVGVKRTKISKSEQFCASDADADESDTGVTLVGFAKPGLPFYLPLWLSMKLERVRVFVGPVVSDKDICLSDAISAPDSVRDFYSWGNRSVLEFIAIRNIKHDSGVSTELKADTQEAVPKWAWRETFKTNYSVHCIPPVGIKDRTIPTAYLSCHASSHTLPSGNAEVLVQSSNTSFDGESVGYDERKSTTIAVDAGVTLRNMLPLSLDWEVAHKPSKHSPIITLDGSSVRREQLKDNAFAAIPFPAPASDSEQSFMLASGDCAEVFACDVSLMNMYVRFRCGSNRTWSQFEPLCSSIPDQFDTSTSDDAATESRRRLLTGMVEKNVVRQVNIQMKDEFGTPLTIGARIFPKSFTNESPTSTFGVDVVIHADLWLRNLTTLPLTFGCPSAQIYVRHEGELGDGDETNDDSAGKVAAEAALLEIASVLELGEKGKAFNNRADEDARTQGDLHVLPYQASSVCEEVFEYIETENSTVKRRWWASEKHDSCRQKPSDYDEKGPDWHWADTAWMIDCTGQAKESEGGWESCRNLVGEKENTFAAKRTFNPSHPFRRRRWFRRRTPCENTADGDHMKDRNFLRGGLNAFHQPVVDAFSITQQELEREASSTSEAPSNAASRLTLQNSAYLKIAIKCGDSQWSSPAVIPAQGQGHGIIRVLSSRWPILTKTSSDAQKETNHVESSASSLGVDESDRPCFKPGNLSPDVFELCYQVSGLSGDWDDFSRLMVVTSRYLLRNDSSTVTMEVKQVGAANNSACVIGPGEVTPFHWADMRLPELVCVRPLVDRYDGTRFYRWSGGVDICNLGMTAIRVRHSRKPHSSTNSLRQLNNEHVSFKLKSVRSLVEIRPGTGGTGMNVSFKEENWRGDGTLFRIENLSPFPIWVAQDGVLANPAASLESLRAARRAAELPATGSEDLPTSDTWPEVPGQSSWVIDHSEVDGDLVRPMTQTSFALDVPFRQGKYAGRKAATMAELLRVRAALAPLSSREGIESTKVIGFTNVGWCFRLNPTKLTGTLSDKLLKALTSVRVLGVITTDGPTRILRFCVMKNSVSGNVFGGAFGDSTVHRKAPYGTSSTSCNTSRQMTVDAAVSVVALAETNGLVSEHEAKKQAFFGTGLGISDSQVSGAIDVVNPKPKEIVKPDMVFSFRASFGAFVFSLVDATPSELAVASLRSVNVVADWNALRTSDASVLISVGWLQVDNHVPGAPFPVAICPDDEPLPNEAEEGGQCYGLVGATGPPPLLLVGLTFAPHHKSGMLCMRSATVSPRNLAVAFDLASIVRLLHFINGIRNHSLRAHVDATVGETLVVASVLDGEYKKRVPFPDIETTYQNLEDAGTVDVESRKFYFEGLTILPCRISLSVAPSRALTPEQASVEGPEAAAIHAAVRKGDVLIGNEGTVLDVRVGRKNKTAIAVVRGVFKSIVVDALLRCDGASMNFDGVALRYHISSGSQLQTYLVAHYLASLRKNVPALIGSLAAFGNPLGLIRGLGDGVSDFVNEPVKGLKKSVRELDPSFVMDGVARGTESLARHAVGGFADSASLLTETFSKNMAVLTLDRRYAQRRDRGMALRGERREISTTFVEGVESGVAKLVRGVLEGVAGVVRAPLRGAEKRGMEGFAKGIGKGLLGLLVKPVIGISDAATDVMLGVKGSVEGGAGSAHLRGVHRHQQVRPRRPMYGRDGVLRPYSLADAAACALMMRTRLAGEKYLSHYDLEDRVALLSVKRLLLLGEEGEDLLLVKFKHIKEVKVRQGNVDQDGKSEWRVIILLKTPRANGSEIEVITCKEEAQALELSTEIKRGMSFFVNET